MCRSALVTDLMDDVVCNRFLVDLLHPAGLACPRCGAALRTFLRPFPGVSKWFLHQYVDVFQWEYNLERATGDFLRPLLVIGPNTEQPP